MKDVVYIALLILKPIILDIQIFLHQQNIIPLLGKRLLVRPPPQERIIQVILSQEYLAIRNIMAQIEHHRQGLRDLQVIPLRPEHHRQGLRDLQVIPLQPEHHRLAFRDLQVIPLRPEHHRLEHQELQALRGIEGDDIYF